jgi:HPt (histidine-containing phosphotransfer) domain-containing protein
MIEPKPMAITKKWPQDSELIKNIRIEFVQSLPVLMQEIDTAFSKRDLEGLGRLFHGIRGSVAYLDDQELINSSSQLERLVDSYNTNKVELLYPSLLKKLLAY